MANQPKAKPQAKSPLEFPVNPAFFEDDAEEALLDCLFINPYQMPDIAFLQAEWFSILRYGYAFAAMRTLFERGETIDEHTVAGELRLRNQWEDFGEHETFWRISGRAKSSVHVVSYARTIARAAAKRGLLKAADLIAGLVDGAESDTAKLKDAAHAIIDEIPNADEGDDLMPLSVAHQSEFDRLEAIQNGELVPSAGIATGYIDLDNILGGGFQASNFIIVAGRPGWGKTAFMLNAAVNQARTGKRVAFFSLEMDDVELVRRVNSMLTGIPTQTLRRGDLNPEQWKLFVDAAGIADNICQNIVVSKIPEVSMSFIKNKSRELLRSDGGIHAVYVDYLGLMQAERDKDNRRAELEVISREFKNTARELKIPVVVGAQMNRAIEGRGKENRDPQLSDLRETGAQEQDADIVMFVYPEDDETEKTQRVIKVEKQRNGPTGKFYLGWVPERTLLKNHADESGKSRVQKFGGAS